MRFALYVLGIALFVSSPASALEDRKAHFTVAYHLGNGMPASKMDLHERGLAFVKKFMVDLEAAPQKEPDYQRSTIIITTNLPAAFCELYAERCLPRRIMLYGNVMRVDEWGGDVRYYKDKHNLADVLWQHGDPIYLKRIQAPQ